MIDRNFTLKLIFINNVCLFFSGNGLVDFKEFISLMDNNCLVQSVDEEMQHLFNMIDKNNDGFITEKEIKTMLKGLGEKVRKKDIRKMIKEADQNKDGKISFTGKLFLALWMPKRRIPDVFKTYLSTIKYAIGYDCRT